MAQVPHKWHRIFHRLIAGITLILGVVVIFASSAALANILGKATSEGTSTTSTENGNKTEGVTTPKAEVKNASEKYNTILKICVGLAIAAGFVQFFSSMYSCFTYTKKGGQTVKIWITLHILIAVLLLTCLLLPFGFDETDGKELSIKKFGSGLRASVGNTVNKMKDTSLMEHLKSGLTLYHIALGIDVAVVFFLSILSCCCLRCGEYDYDSLDNNDKDFY